MMERTESNAIKVSARATLRGVSCEDWEEWSCARRDMVLFAANVDSMKGSMVDCFELLLLIGVLSGYDDAATLCLRATSS